MAQELQATDLRSSRASAIQHFIDVADGVACQFGVKIIRTSSFELKKIGEGIVVICSVPNTDADILSDMDIALAEMAGDNKALAGKNITGWYRPAQ